MAQQWLNRVASEKTDEFRYSGQGWKSGESRSWFDGKSAPSG